MPNSCSKRWRRTSRSSSRNSARSAPRGAERSSRPTNRRTEAMSRVKVIGAGLAGSECAFGLAQNGHKVELFEMRPSKMTPAHQTSNLAELVCSNSFRSSAVTNAVGLLKKEMAMLDSLVIRCAEGARVPAGDAFAVDRERFAAAVTSAIANEPNINVRREEVTSLDRSGFDYLI